MSIDDYLDDLLSGSSDSSKKAIMKLTRLIENLGIIMVKSTERMEDTINDIEVRLSRVESQIGGGAPVRSPSSAMSEPQQTAGGGRSGPSIKGGNVPKLNIGGNSSPSSAPPNTSGSSVPPPNLSGGSPPGGSPPGGSPPGGSPSSPMGNPFAGSSFANELANAANSLQKVDPEQVKKENGSPGGSPGGSPLGGPSSSMIQNAKAGLKKINPDEIKKEKEQAQSSSGPPQMGFQSELRQKMSERSKRMKEKSQEEPVQQTQQPATPKKSKKQMKESLQNELRSAFSRLLESDTKE